MWRVSVLLLALACSAAAQVRPTPDFPPGLIWLDQGAPVPHSIENYRGRVVLIDFWEYTCINCIRDFAVVKRWYAKYRPYGFEVIGVHFGEFPMGFKLANVRRAAKRFQLPWPIAVDLTGAVGRAYGADSWPARYLVDQRGNIVMSVAGEVDNHAMEEKIRALLAITHPEVAKIPLDPPENAFRPECGVTTQETYVGQWFGRGAVENPKAYHTHKPVDFTASGEPDDGHVMLAGKWRAQQDRMESAAAGASATLRYHARSVYSVLSVQDKKRPVRVDIEQDGKPLARADAGADVQFDGATAYVEVTEPRMYLLVKNRAFGAHVLRLTAQAPGFNLHSFTYGNNCQQNF